MFSAAFHFIIIWPQYFSLLLKSYFHFHPKMADFQFKNDFLPQFHTFSYHTVNRGLKLVFVHCEIRENTCS